MSLDRPAGAAAHRLCWTDQTGARRSQTFRTKSAAFAHAAKVAPRDALHFHDLRHCYATWLVSRGVPINVVQKVLGHEQASTTLNRYTHTPDDLLQQVRDAFTEGAADFSLTLEAGNDPLSDDGLAPDGV